MSGFKRISSEIKAEVLTRAKAGTAVAELSKQYAISTKTMYHWLSAEVNGGISQLEITKLRRQNEELLKMIGLLTLEKNQLKKKAAH